MCLHFLHASFTHEKHFVGYRNQVFVKPLSMMLPWPFGHDDTIAELLCPSGSLGKGKGDLRERVTGSFHDAGQNPNAIPQKAGIEGGKVQ